MKDKKIQIFDSIKLHLNKNRSQAKMISHIKLYLLKYCPLLLILCFNLNFFLKLILCALWWVVITMFFDHRVITDFTPTIRIWFGVPGAGKTSRCVSS